MAGGGSSPSTTPKSAREAGPRAGKVLEDPARSTPSTQICVMVPAGAPGICATSCCPSGIMGRLCSAPPSWTYQSVSACTPSGSEARTRTSTGSKDWGTAGECENAE